MSSDTSELTFIRCPSCRSLVPATSRRCRMCGFLLAPGENSEDVDMQERRESRQRQREESPSDTNPVAHAPANQPVDSTPVAGDHNKSSSNGSQRSEVLAQPPETEAHSPDKSGDANPLGDYLAESSPQQEKTSSPEEKKSSHLATESEATEKVSHADKPEDDAAQKSMQKKPGVFRVGRDRGDNSSPLTQTPREQENVGEVKHHVSESAKPEVLREKQGDEHVVNQEGAKKGNDNAKEKPEEKQKMEALAKTEREDGVRRRPDPVREERKPRADMHTNEQASSHSGETGSVSKAANGVSQSGRIFGWFVSYENPDGVSHLIREGKFFLSGSVIRDSDFAVDHPSISTPHAMLSVNARGFFIQDLMSEQGIFTRRADESKWTREEEVFEVCHGDWVKFGEVEFLVCLVPSSGLK
jgi:hypothetical protein